MERRMSCFHSQRVRYHAAGWMVAKHRCLFHRQLAAVDPSMQQRSDKYILMTLHKMAEPGRCVRELL